MARSRLALRKHPAPLEVSTSRVWKFWRLRLMFQIKTKMMLTNPESVNVVW
jgi:hypothetical protein